MTPTIRFNERDILRLRRRFVPTADTMDTVAKFMEEQVKDRFIRHGGPLGVDMWPQKRARSWGYDDKRAILTGATGTLLHSFFSYGEQGRAVVASHCPYSLVHQLGTVGRGGKLPTIKPKKAKALFIPLTDRAINSHLLPAEAAGWVKIQGKNPFGNSNRKRFGIREHLAGRAPTYLQLKKGRLHKGKLQVQDPRTGEWKDGIPDFIFLAKADIPPRPMLPVSEAERAAAVELLMDAMAQQKAA